MNITRSNKRKNKNKNRINKRKGSNKKRKPQVSYKTNNVFGGSVLGVGNDGCVVDSISCGDYSKDNGYVAKIFNTNSPPINMVLNERLKILDPLNERFNPYYFPNSCNYVYNDSFNDDFKICQKQSTKYNKQFQYTPSQITNSYYGIPFQKKLFPINDTDKLSKSQWRYLRESIDILAQNRISHGDLPGNVMVDQYDRPIIIDWERGTLIDPENSDFNMLIAMDKTAFDANYKIKKNK